MSTTFFTVGPSQIHPLYNQFYNQGLQQNIGSISHRSAAFRAIYQQTDAALRSLMQIPDTHAILFASSASEIWERIIFNIVAYKSAHFVNGAFSKKFCEYAQALGKQTQIIKAAEGQTFDFDSIKIDDDVELICTTQNETSTGVKWNAKQLIDLKKKYPTKIICTDIVSSAPLHDVDFDYMDMAFFSVQKAFGMPAGLGIWIVDKALLQKTHQIKNNGISIGAHQTLDAYLTNYANWETPSTPNVMAIYCLGQMANWYNENNFSNIKNNMQQRIDALYIATANHAILSPFVLDSNCRSTTVAVFKTNVSSKVIIDKAKEQGLIIGSGYSSYKDKQIRIGNFPAIANDDWLTMQDFLVTFLVN